MLSSSRSARGAGWVWAQFVLIAAILVLGAFTPIWPDWLRIAGIPLVVVGMALGIWAGRTLGPSLTPYPLPREEGVLVERGPYRHFRHPIYLAGVLVFLGYGLISSVPATAAVVLLAVLWHFKAGVEERHLAERFPGFTEYARRVPRGI
jgi:protein-S-isoprenylcysteine O-methyltransferase Ste14